MASRWPETYQGLHDGVVGGIHVSVEWERALPVAVVGCVALWSDDPVLVRKQTERSSN